MTKKHSFLRMFKRSSKKRKKRFSIFHFDEPCEVHWALSLPALTPWVPKIHGPWGHCPPLPPLSEALMQCLHCLRNVHDQNTLLLCRPMIRSLTLPIFCYHYAYIFFCKCQERNLAWNWYGSTGIDFREARGRCLLGSDTEGGEICLPPWFFGE